MARAAGEREDPRPQEERGQRTAAHQQGRKSTQDGAAERRAARTHGAGSRARGRRPRPKLHRRAERPERPTEAPPGTSTTTPRPQAGAWKVRKNAQRAGAVGTESKGTIMTERSTRQGKKPGRRRGARGEKSNWLRSAMTEGGRSARGETGRKTAQPEESGTDAQAQAREEKAAERKQEQEAGRRAHAPRKSGGGQPGREVRENTGRQKPDQERIRARAAGRWPSTRESAKTGPRSGQQSDGRDDERGQKTDQAGPSSRQQGDSHQH